MRISSVERLKDQGSNGSIAYEWATKIARAKDRLSIGTVIVGTTSRRVSEWCNPSKAPPTVNLKRRISARLSITKGAGDAMISYPNINEIKNVLYETGTNPQAA
jgi:hypothetical protein